MKYRQTPLWFEKNKQSIVIFLFCYMIIILQIVQIYKYSLFISLIKEFYGLLFFLKTSLGKLIFKFSGVSKTDATGFLKRTPPTKADRRKAACMDIKNLTYFITLAEQKNMTRAADLLYVSQPSLSYYLNKLEQEVGMPLFVRHKNELQLTRAGELYLKAAHQVVAIRQDLYSEIAALSTRPRMVIATASLWGNQALSAIIPRLVSRFPDVSLEMTTMDYLYLQSDLISSATDFSLLSVPSEKAKDENLEILHREAIYLAIPADHPFALAHPQKDHLSAEELFTAFSKDSLIVSRPGSSNRIVIEEFYKIHEQKLPAAIYEVNGLPLTLDIIDAHNGIAFVPESGLKGNPRVRRFTVGDGLFRYNALWHRSNMLFTPVQTAFVQLVRNYFYAV